MEITINVMRRALTEFTGQACANRSDTAIRAAYEIYVNTFSVRRTLGALGA